MKVGDLVKIPYPYLQGKIVEDRGRIGPPLVGPGRSQIWRVKVKGFGEIEFREDQLEKK